MLEDILEQLYDKLLALPSGEELILQQATPFETHLPAVLEVWKQGLSAQTVHIVPARSARIEVGKNREARTLIEQGKPILYLAYLKGQTTPTANIPLGFPEGDISLKGIDSNLLAQPLPRKGITLERLALQTRQYLSLLARLEESNESRDHDHLTGLANRRVFETVYDIEMAILKRRSHRSTQYPISLLYLDVNYFKEINDCFTHEYGDQVLKQLASLLHNRVRRNSDLIARLGGDEFALLLPETTLEQATHLAHSLAQDIETYEFQGSPPFLETDKIYPYPPRHVTISIGIACTQNLPADANLRECADMALYQAKKLKTNRIIALTSALEQLKATPPLEREEMYRSGEYQRAREIHDTQPIPVVSFDPKP